MSAADLSAKRPITADTIDSDPTALRLCLRTLGYRPVPVSGKAVYLPNWVTACENADEAEMQRWPTTFTYNDRGKAKTYRGDRHSNTGILCGRLIGLDIDILVPELAQQIDNLAESLLGSTPLHRIGKAPKLLRCYRSETPLRKIETPELFLPDGTKVQVEAMGTGQQVVGFGIHPDTHAPYTWPKSSPLDVPLMALPVVSEQSLRTFMAVAEAVLRQAGGRTEKEIEAAAAKGAARETNEARARDASGGTFFRQVNDAALESLSKWVPRLFPKAEHQANTGAYRIRSADLGRDYQEDLSIHPDGVQDFGPRQRLTPCDAIMEFGGAPTVTAAAFTLCDWLGRDPAEFGWKLNNSKSKGAKAANGEAKAEAGQPAAEQTPGAAVADDDGLITEDSVALAFARLHRHELRYCHHAGAWYQWTGQYWRREETKLAYAWARQLARQFAKDTDNFKARLSAGKATFSSGVERMAQSDRTFAVTSDMWDQDIWLLGTPGGTVDLRTGQLRPAQQQDHITKQTAVAPAETADCPMWCEFLHQATRGDEALTTFLQRWFGYCLTGDTREEALLFGYGPGGNGKGVLMHTVFSIMRDYAKKAAMDAFVVTRTDKHTTDIAMLAGARMVMTTETEEGQAWAEAKVKDLTGNDPITARFMRRDNFTFIPQFKLTISGNHKPSLKAVDDAIKRRVLMFPFLHKPANPDKTLSARLKREWPQILRWMITGCIEWQQFGLCPPPAVLETTKEYFDAQDYFGRWLEECCKLHPTLETKPSALLRSFQDWCRANGEDASDNRRFRGLIEKTPGLRYVTVRGKQSVRGIGLNPSPDDGRYGDG